MDLILNRSVCVKESPEKFVFLTKNYLRTMKTTGGEGMMEAWLQNGDK